MCLLKNFNELIHRVCRNDDVTVLKIMKGCGKNNQSLISPFCPHIRYEVGDTMKPAMKMRVDDLDRKTTLGAGVIHAYADSDTCYAVLESDVLPYANRGEVFYLVKCTIPKGTPHWVDRSGTQYASTKLVLNEIVGSIRKRFMRSPFIL